MAAGNGVDLDHALGRLAQLGRQLGDHDGPQLDHRVVAPLRKLFSKDQRAFFAEHAPEGVGFEDLSLLGPIFVLKLKGVPEGFARKMVVELWLYPDGTRILELSTKCAPSEAFQVAAESRAFLSERGIEIDGDAQTTKTRKALEFFSKQLTPTG